MAQTIVMKFGLEVNENHVHVKGEAEYIFLPEEYICTIYMNLITPCMISFYHPSLKLINIRITCQQRASKKLNSLDLSYLKMKNFVAIKTLLLSSQLLE